MITNLDDWYVNKKIPNNLFINSIADKKFNYKIYCSCKYPDIIIIYKENNSFIRLINKNDCLKANNYFKKNKNTLNKNLKNLKKIITNIELEIKKLDSKKSILKLINILRKFDFYFRIVFYENTVRKDIDNKLYIEIKNTDYKKHILNILSKISCFLKINADDLIFLTVSEIESYLKLKINLNDLNKLILKRKKGYLYYIKGKKEIFFYNLKEISKVYKNINKYNLKNKINGNVTFKDKRKKIKGNVILIKNKKDYNKLYYVKLNNIILVLVKLDLEITSFSKKVKAIITDQGSFLSHASIIAREYNIPCIVNTINGTKFLKDKDFIEINLENGEIYKK